MEDAGFGNTYSAIHQRRYLGSKTKLLSFIESILKDEKVTYHSFADIFAGTGVVADYFHDKADIIVNDILDSNYQCYLAFFGGGHIRNSWLSKKLEEYNNVDLKNVPDNYFSNNFSDTYFNSTNAKKIGFIRDDIEKLYLKKNISKREKAYLLTSLIYALDRIANTVGHYDAYRKIDIPDKKLDLKPLAIRDRKYNAEIFRIDANELVRKIYADVVYIDTPYNSRQYSDAYHLLENIASWEKQPVHGVAKKIDRLHLKSQYNLKSAGNAFSDLINNIKAKYILVSFNDMGTRGNARSQSRISDHEIISALERRGRVKIYEKHFNQFKAGLSNQADLKERIFFCEIRKKSESTTPVRSSGYNTHIAQYVKSPLNYTGGKYKLLPQLAKLFPKDISTFYDVFCGGANIGVNINAESILCIDKNKQVIELLQLMQKTNFEELNQNILSIIEKYNLSQSFIHGYSQYNSESSGGLGRYNKQAFIALRNAYNTCKTSEKAPLLLVLILYAFNNQIRFNSQGHFNLPIGKRDYNGSSRRNLAHFNAITNQKNITFAEGDFRDLPNTHFPKGSFVYLDPPYLLGLASYNESGGWTVKEERDLYATLTDLNRKGIRFALSNVLEHKGETNEIMKNWAEKNNFKINKLNYDYRNSNYHSTAKNNKTTEVLITNY